MAKRKSQGRVTLQDLGDAVGVSAKTVSNVIRNQGWVSDAVRLKVLQAVEEMGYRPNLAARQLRGGRSGMIALVVPNLREHYFAEFASSLVSAAQRRDLTVLISQTGGQREHEIAAIEGHSLPGLDGIVLSPLALQREDLHRRRSTSPLVLLGEYGELLDEGNVHHVGVDNIRAAKAATTHLIERGCRRIGVVGFQHDTSQATSQFRFQGYREALAEAGLPFDPLLVGSVERFNRAEGSEAVRRLLDAGVPCDGLFCFSDSLAFGAIHTLVTAKLSVPDEVIVIGFDNIEEGRYSLPAFDTIDPGADTASEAILDLLADPDGQPQHIEVPFEVIQRS